MGASQASCCAAQEQKDCPGTADATAVGSEPAIPSAKDVEQSPEADAPKVVDDEQSKNGLAHAVTAQEAEASGAPDGATEAATPAVSGEAEAADGADANKDVASTVDTAATETDAQDEHKDVGTVESAATETDAQAESASAPDEKTNGAEAEAETPSAPDVSASEPAADSEKAKSSKGTKAAKSSSAVKAKSSAKVKAKAKSTEEAVFTVEHYTGRFTHPSFVSMDVELEISSPTSATWTVLKINGKRQGKARPMPVQVTINGDDITLSDGITVMEGKREGGKMKGTLLQEGVGGGKATFKKAKETTPR